MCRRGPRSTATTGWSCSASTRRSSRSSTTSRRSGPPSRRWASTTRSRSTTTSRSGVPSTTRTGPPSTSSTPQGRIRYHHFGEEAYERSERVIQQLLAEAGSDGVDQDLVSVEPDGVYLAADWDTLGSPETYVGYARATGFASPGGLGPDRSRVYVEPARLALNQWALSGDWTVGHADHDPERARRPDRAPLPRAGPQPRAGRPGRRRADALPGADRRAAAEPRPRARRRRAGHRDRRRGAALPARSARTGRSPTAPSRSPSSTPAPRPTCSRSASREIGWTSSR